MIYFLQHSFPCFKSVNSLFQAWKFSTFSGKSHHHGKSKNKEEIQNKIKPQKLGIGLGDSFLHLKLSIKMLSTHITFLSNSRETWHFRALLLSQSFAPAPCQTVFSFMAATSVPPDVSVFYQALLSHFDQGTCTQIIP